MNTTDNQTSENIKLDIEETEKLLSQATRKSVQDVLSIHLNQLKTKLSTSEAKSNVKSKENKPLNPSLYATVIRNYSWDESDKFLKIYVSLKDVQSLSKEKVTSNFIESGFTLDVTDLDGKNYNLSINKLAGDIDAKASYHKVKTDMIAIMIAKETPGKKWGCVTSEEMKAKAAKQSNLDSKSRANDDPSAGLMDMMKQMYDEGDDNMKRMLKKSWYEAQNKQSSGNFMNDLPQ